MSNTPQSRDDLIAEVVRRYLSGESISSVAAAIEESSGDVKDMLKQAGVEPEHPEAGVQPRDAAMAVHPSASKTSADQGEAA